MATVSSYHKDPIHEDLRMFQSELKAKFPNLVITSGFRKNAKTKQGNTSRHATGEAIDIRFNPEVREYLWNTREGIALLNKYKLGFLDESTKENMKRTGATGKHFHIGRDSTLVPATTKRFKELWGSEPRKEPSLATEPYVNSEQTDLENEENIPKFEDVSVPHTRTGIGLPTVKETIDEQNTSEEQESTSKEKEALLQKQREYEFLEDFTNGKIDLGQEAEPMPQAQAPLQNYVDTFASVSAFVDNPLMQKGGTVDWDKQREDTGGISPFLVAMMDDEIEEDNITEKDLLLRQAWKESSFRPKVKNSLGYMGLAQVGEEVISDYKRITGTDNIDPYNPQDAYKIQKWYMDNLGKASFIDKPNQSEEVFNAKRLAAYNWGRGNLYETLTKAKKKGIDIYNSLDWLEDAPKETRDYVNKILGKDDEFNEEFDSAVNNPRYKNIITHYKKTGGTIPVSERGVFDSEGNPVIVPSPNISMEGVEYPILGVGDNGESKVMLPEMNYYFDGAENVLELPFTKKEMEGYTVSEDGIPLQYLDEVVISNKPKKPYRAISNAVRQFTSKDSLVKNKETVRIGTNTYNKTFQGDNDNAEFKEIEDFNVNEIITPKNNEKIPMSNNQNSFLKTVSDIGKMNREQVKQVQNKLSEMNLLEPSAEVFAEPKTNEDIIKVQEVLRDLGYDLGKYGKNKDGVDGIYGRKTKSALEEYNKKAKGIDGIAGNKTLQAIKDYETVSFIENQDPVKSKERLQNINNRINVLEYQKTLNEEGYFKGIDFTPANNKDISENIYVPFNVTSDKTCSRDECTYFVNNEIEKQVKQTGREQAGAYGDAWTLSTNLIGSGGQEVFSVFEDTKPSLSYNEIEDYMKTRIASTPKPSVEEINAGDVVNLFYEGSSSKNVAYDEGHKYFTTHTGIVKQDADGNKFVEHNVHGKIKREKLTDLVQGKGKSSKGMMAISAIIRPNYNIDTQSTNKFYDSSDVSINTKNVSNFESLGNEKSALFSQTLINNREALIKDIPVNNSEFKDLVRASRAIGWKESRFDTSIDSGSLKKTAGNIREFVGGRETSRGLTQMKDEENLIPELRGKYIKQEGINLNNPQDSAITTFYALSSRYLMLKDFATANNLTYNQDELTKLAMLSWNEPVDRVAKTMAKYGNYDEVKKAYNIDEEGNDKSAHGYSLAFTAYNKYLK